MHNALVVVFCTILLWECDDDVALSMVGWWFERWIILRRKLFLFSYIDAHKKRGEKNIFNYRCLDNKLKISTELLLSNTSREVTSTSVCSAFFSLGLCLPHECAHMCVNRYIEPCTTDSIIEIYLSPVYSRVSARIPASVYVFGRSTAFKFKSLACTLHWLGRERESKKVSERYCSYCCWWCWTKTEHAIILPCRSRSIENIPSIEMDPLWEASEEDNKIMFMLIIVKNLSFFREKINWAVGRFLRKIGGWLVFN